jgi:hypothetical protein
LWTDLQIQGQPCEFLAWNRAVAQREAIGAVINFGSSVGHIPTRGHAMSGQAVPLSIATDCLSKAWGC